MKIFIYLFYAVALTLLYKIGSLIIRKRYKEPSFVGFRATRPVEALKIVKIVAFFAFLGIILWFSLVYGASFEDDFNSYNNGQLLNQGSWVAGNFDAVNPQGFEVESTTTYEGSKAVSVHLSDTFVTSDIKKVFTPESSATTYFSLRYSGTMAYYDMAYVTFWSGSSLKIFFRVISSMAGIVTQVYSGGDWQEVTPPTAFQADTWYPFKIEWDDANHNDRFRVANYNNASSTWADWSNWYAVHNSPYTTIDTIDLYAYNFLPNDTFVWDMYWDTFSETDPTTAPPAEFRIWGIDPASSTEITATSTEFTFGYEGFASTIWNGIIVNFCEEITGICANEKKYPKADLSGTSGEKTLTFDDFDFDANGHYDLIGDAYFGMFNSNWEWSEGYTGDVVSPDYYVMINFEGLPEIFQVEVPETWYTEHTEYATSTAFFSTISGILTPLFSKIGEFGDRISTFFDQNEAYSRGKNIGAILPTFKLYIAQFSFLFGGFPIIETFILAMVVMVGFFLFKLVFRIVRG